METRLFIGSGFNNLFPRYTEILRITSEPVLTLDLDSPIGIDLDSELTQELDLSSRVYG